jgi:tellurium resistance protein TerD
LDVSCFLLDRDKKTRMNEDFVFYNNMHSLESAVVHNGDSRTGAGDGDDETISIGLQSIPLDVFRVVFVLSIYRGEENEQSLNKVRNCYFRLINQENSQELLRYEMTPDMDEKGETAMIIGALKREGPKWHFKVLGDCVEGGLGKIASDYDIIVQGGSEF